MRGIGPNRFSVAGLFVSAGVHGRAWVTVWVEPGLGFDILAPRLGPRAGDEMRVLL
ncbi:unnamed protein product [Prunus armeniaca]